MRRSVFSSFTSIVTVQVLLIFFVASAFGFSPSHHDVGLNTDNDKLLTRSSAFVDAETRLSGVTEAASTLPQEEEREEKIPGLLQVPILPARTPLSSFLSSDDDNGNDNDNDEQAFSILSWNILLPNSRDNWWNHKMYNPWVDMEHRQWPHRQRLIQQRLLESQADIICLQECDGDTFEKDFEFLKQAGYEACLHKKYRFRCATFYRNEKFCLDQVAHKDRTLVTSLKVKSAIQALEISHHDDHRHQRRRKNNNNNNNKNEKDVPLDYTCSRMIHVINCHLSGGAAPERRLRQVHGALDQVRKWNNKAALALQKQHNANRPNPKILRQAAHEAKLHKESATIVCGDFNSDGNTGVRRLLVEGSVSPEWREPQYPTVPLTSKPKRNPLLLDKTTCMMDAAELAYGANVCDGDYGHDDIETCRPPTYVVPNLASLLLSSPNGAVNEQTRTEFGLQVAQGLADTLGLQSFTRDEMEQAFERIDVDDNQYIDANEVQVLLESVYVATYGEKIRVEKERFFEGFEREHEGGLTRTEFKRKIKALRTPHRHHHHHRQPQQISIDDDSDASNSNDFGQRLSKGVIDTLGLEQHHTWQEAELICVFDKIDLDGNNIIDKDEIQALLESAYLVIYGDEIEAQKKHFFGGFQESESRQGLALDQFIEKLSALQQELEGGSEGHELVQVRTNMDVQRMIARFSPLLRSSLDLVFDKYSSDGKCLTKDEVNAFLTKVNGEPGRGGTWRHSVAILEEKAELERNDWYEIYARELAEGKWWQVVYDLETCGGNIRAPRPAQIRNNNHQHYQAWLDYVYFDTQRLTCQGLQEGLTSLEQSRIYNDGDALPNEWHPSDHLPVAAVFSWND